MPSVAPWQGASHHWDAKHACTNASRSLHNSRHRSRHSLAEISLFVRIIELWKKNRYKALLLP